MFTPRKRRECSENIVLYVCFWHTASCLSPSYIGCDHFCIQYSTISFSWLQGMKQFQYLFLEPGVVILYSTTEYDHMGAFRCVDACTPLLFIFIFYVELRTCLLSRSTCMSLLQTVTLGSFTCLCRVESPSGSFLRWMG